MSSSSLPSSSESTGPLSQLCRQWLGDVWERMGLEGEAVQERERTAATVVTSTLKDMREEEEKTLAQIVDRVEKHGMERARLAKELGEAAGEPDPSLGLVQLERLLRHEVGGLRARKEERMKEVLEFKRQDKAVCRQMAMEPFAISSTNIPSPEQFQALKKHLDDMNSLRQKRLGKFSEAKLSILGMLEQLEAEPDSSFERNVVCEEDEAFVLSADNLDAVEAYLERLSAQVASNRRSAESMRERMLSIISKLELGEEEKQRVHSELAGHSPSMLKEIRRRLDEMEVLKLEKIGQIIEATRTELGQLWDACYYSQDQREKFAPFHSCDMSEDLLEEHEREIDRLRTYYEANVEMFRKVAKRQELWSKMLELDAKRKDPTHLFKAKGPALLIEERERKRVTRNLPKVDQELAEAMAEYLERNGTPFLVGGQPYDDFILQQEAEWTQQKEMESKEKQREKRMQIEQETIYGTTRPTTPAKLRANLTQAAAANSTASLKRKAPGQVTPGGPGGGPGGSANGAKRIHLAPSMYRPNATGSAAKASTTGVAAPGSSKSRYALRGQASSRRRILGESTNASVLHSGMHHGGAGGGGGAAKSNKMAAPAFKPTTEETLSSVTSENFVRGAPVNSTFGPTPESVKKKRRSPRLASAAAAAHSTPVYRSRQHQQLRTTLSMSRRSPRTPPAVFKTPRNRVQTPGARSTSKKKQLALTLRSGGKIPFLM